MSFLISFFSADLYEGLVYPQFTQSDRRKFVFLFKRGLFPDDGYKNATLKMRTQAAISIHKLNYDRKIAAGNNGTGTAHLEEWLTYFRH